MNNFDGTYYSCGINIPVLFSTFGNVIYNDVTGLTPAKWVATVVDTCYIVKHKPLTLILPALKSVTPVYVGLTWLYTCVTVSTAETTNLS